MLEMLISERKLLQPGRLTVTQTAQGNPDLSTLVSALQKSGLAGVISLASCPYIVLVYELLRYSHTHIPAASTQLACHRGASVAA